MAANYATEGNLINHTLYLGLPARWKSVWTTRSAPPINNAIADLREVLGNQTYESVARKGETMTTAEMVAYAYDQIDQARAELNAVSK
jgi:hypothetical protein